MPEIRFSTGLQTYSLNGRCEVVFNPTDASFARRLYETFEELDKKQEAYRACLEALTADADGDGGKELFQVSAEMDREMRALLDGIFDRPICEELFGSMNVYAMAGGLPVWANLLLALLELTGDAFAKEQAQTNPALEKYLAKYKG